MAPLVNHNLQATNRNMRDLLGFVRDGHLNLDPPYQRGHVWTMEQRVALIKSLLLGVPVAALVLNVRDGAHWRRNGSEIYACIDGKQRLTTIGMFFDGDIAVPRLWFEADWIKEGAPSLRDNVTWSDFELHAQRYMGQGFNIPVAEARLGSLAEEAEVYLLINGAGTAHTETELAAARQIARRKS
jgi:hypothetical protein